MHTLMSRTREIWGADGLESSSTSDVSWDHVKGIRLEWLNRTDAFYYSDRWALLSSTHKGKLNTFRQALRDLPQDHAEANDAADNMPEAEEWFMDA